LNAEIDKLFLYDIKNFDFTNGQTAVIMAINPKIFASSAERFAFITK
jgi:hypothetical protein